MVPKTRHLSNLRPVVLSLIKLSHLERPLVQSATIMVALVCVLPTLTPCGGFITPSTMINLCGLPHVYLNEWNRSLPH